MTDNLTAATRLYQAFEQRDPRQLLAALTPDFRGVVADGMPEELGGVYDGAETMLRDCWARVFALFDVRPVPEEYLSAGNDRMVVIGRYTGAGRASGLPVSAAFAHVLRFADGRVSELVQITDTVCWHRGLNP
jgi:ketosteroid isomerase-like protein